MRPWGQDDGGRWPVRWPVRTLQLLVMAVAVGFGVGQFSASYWTPLQQLYLKSYLRSRVTAALGIRRGSYDFIYLVTAKERRLALDDEVQPADGGWALTAAAQQFGAPHLMWGHESLDPATVAPFLSYWIYDNRSVLAWPLGVALVVFVVGAVPAIRKDREAMGRANQRRRRGPELMETAAAFNRRVKSNRWFRKGIGIQLGAGTITTLTLRGAARLPAGAEYKHLAIFGAPGSGKSSLFRQLMLQARARGQRAVIWDASQDWTQEMYRPDLGDELVTPNDLRSAYWALEDEITTSLDADAWAAAFYPHSPREQKFFVEAPRRIVAYLLRFRPDAATLRRWLSDEKELDRMLTEHQEGRDLQHLVSKRAGPQRGGVLAALNMIANSLSLVPHEADTTRRWSTAAWAKDGRGFLFISSEPMTLSRLSPLLSAWIDMLILRTMVRPSERSQHVPVWFFLDEFASLQRLQQAMVALAQGRKSKNPIVMGVQTRAQLDEWYGQQADGMVACTGTQVYFKIPESNTGAVVEKTIGHVELDRVRQSRSQRGWTSQYSEQLDDQIRPLFMQSELAGWDDMHGVLKFNNAVLPIVIPYMKLPTIAKDFVPRPDAPALIPPPTPAKALTAAPGASEIEPELDWQWI